MPIKQTIPTNSGDSVQFGNATTPISAQVTGAEVSTGNGYLALNTANSGTVIERMRIDNAGNVGIGTSTPAEKLNINNASGNCKLRADSGTNIVYMGWDSADAIGEVATNQAWRVRTGSSYTERMRIDASGNVQIGRTSSLVGFSKNLTIGNGTNSVEFNPDRTYFDASAYYILNTSAAGVKLTNGATSWTAQSDERLKDIIEPIENAAYKVSTLRAVIGKYKTDEEGTRRSFLIAQDVDAVLPEAVDKSNLDELGVRYSETIPLLVAAIQELNAKVTALELQLGAL